MDDTEQTKFLDEHDLNEVLNKLPEEAFDIFTGITGGKDLNEVLNKLSGRGGTFDIFTGIIGGKDLDEVLNKLPRGRAFDLFTDIT